MKEVSVQITDDITEMLSEGSHTFYLCNPINSTKCRVNVLVIKNSELMGVVANVLLGFSHYSL